MWRNGIPAASRFPDRSFERDFAPFNAAALLRPDAIVADISALCWLADR
jgi:hypothetical protein